MIIIAIYLTIGVLMNFFGPIAKKIDKEIIKFKKPSFLDLLSKKSTKSFRKKILFELILRLLTVLFYPFLFMIISIDYLRSKSQKQVDLNSNLDDDLLYFRKMAGAGIVNCNSCNYSQNVISFLHGHGSNSWNNSGFQCQQCGKFHEIEYDMNNSKKKLCECGGSLSSEKPLFCPICKKTDLIYTMLYIT